MVSAIVSCAGTVPGPPSTPPTEDALPAEDAAAPSEVPSPRALASLRLTEQGRMLLENGYPDDAISILERAVGLNPKNGENYYYLAEAWIAKRDTVQAEEFNRLAALYLKGNDWKVKLLDQRERIRNRGR